MKYIGFYTLPEMKNRNLDVAASAQTKMEYIVQVLGQIKESVQVISPAWTLNTKGTYKQQEFFFEKNGSVVSLPTFGAKCKLLKKMKIIFMQWMLLLYLLKNLEKKEEIIVYHSLYLVFPVWFVAKLKRLKVILEVEEIYADVLENQIIKKFELAYFENACAYIFPTSLLSEVVNKSRKPEVIVHGTYHVEKERTMQFADGRIHVVYAGTLDPRKGGALASVTAASALPNNYHLHILGFGTLEMEKQVLQVIEKNSSEEHAKVTYEGLITGEEYIEFLQACDIGLSTQNPDAQFNNTSFPSKILSYMANGLRVVSIRIPAVEYSAVGDLVTYYEYQSAEEIARAVCKVNIDREYDSRTRIRKLNEIFVNELEEMLEELKYADS
ncbi:MAG: glycosyltransferase [Lachnospiraceae bacterium]|nr:glycosyltransferase [Lachnospiraceae bacterium]